MENKMSQAEAAKQLLAKKKQLANSGGKPGGAPASGQQLRSQINKKPNNQKRRTGV